MGQIDCDHILTGKVIDNHDDQPLIGAIVQVGDKVGVTNHDGVYVLTDLCHQTYEITITHISCDDYSGQINITSSSTNKTFYLEHHELEEIEVEATRQRGQYSKAVTTIHGEEIANQQVQTFSELIEDVNGVSILKTGSTITKPVINGLHSQRILLVNNGMRMEGQQWGLEHAPEIDPYAVQTLSVIQGAGSVEYGADAIGGVILVEPASLPDFYGIDTSISLAANTNGRAGTLSANVLGKQKILGLPLSFQAQGTLRKSGNLKAPNYYLDNTGTEESSFTIRGAYLGDTFGAEINTSIYNNNLGILTDSHVGSVRRILEIIENGEPFVDRGFSYDQGRPRQEILHEINQFKAYYNSNLGKLTLNLSRQYNGREEFDRFDDTPGLDLKTETFTEDLSLKHSFFEKMNGKVGIQIQQQDYRFEGFYLIPEFQQNSIGAYLFEEFTLNENILLEAGFRYDRKSYTYQIDTEELEELSTVEIPFESIENEIGELSNTFNNLITGSFGASLQLSDAFTIRPNLGYGIRQPLPNELFSDGVHHGTALWEVGDPNLNTEKATNFQLNADLNLGKTKATINSYYNLIDDYIYLIPASPLDVRFTIRGSFPIYVQSQTDASLLGTNYQISHSFKDDDLKFTTGGALLWAEDKRLNTPLIFMPSHRFNHRLDYQFSDSFWGSISLQNVLEQKRVPPQELIDDFAAPPPAYSLLDLGVGYTTKLLGNKIDIIGSVENTTNNEYRDYLDRFRYYAHAPGINIGARINYNF